MARHRTAAPSVTVDDPPAAGGTAGVEVLVPEVLVPVDLVIDDDTGRRIRAVRRKQRLSRSAVARSAGLTRREVAAYERGASVPAADLWCIAGSCGVDVGELLAHREPLQVGADTLSIGDTVRRLRDGATTDEVLTGYAEMVRSLRGLGPDEPADVREADVAALADSLDASPDEVQSRLDDLLGAPGVPDSHEAVTEVGDVDAIDRFLALAPAVEPPVDLLPDLVPDLLPAAPADDPLAALRAAEPEPEPEPELLAEPESELLVEPEPELLVESEPESEPEPDLLVEPEPEPDALAWRAEPGPWEAAGPGWRIFGGPQHAVAHDGTLALRPGGHRVAVADVPAGADHAVRATLADPVGVHAGLLVLADVIDDVNGDVVTGYTVGVGPDGVTLEAWARGADHPVLLDRAPLANPPGPVVELAVAVVADRIVVAIDRVEVAVFVGVSRRALEAGLRPNGGERTGVVAPTWAGLTVRDFGVAPA